MWKWIVKLPPGLVSTLRIDNLNSNFCLISIFRDSDLNVWQPQSLTNINGCRWHLFEKVFPLPFLMDFLRILHFYHTNRLGQGWLVGAYSLAAEIQHPLLMLLSLQSSCHQQIERVKSFLWCTHLFHCLEWGIVWAQECPLWHYTLHSWGFGLYSIAMHREPSRTLNLLLVEMLGF